MESFFVSIFDNVMIRQMKDVLDELKNTTNIQYNYSNVRGIEQFHIFVKDIEIINGITFPDENQKWMIQYYGRKVNMSSYNIINNSYANKLTHLGLIQSEIYEMPNDLQTLKKELSLHILGKSNICKKNKEKIDTCDRIYNMVKDIKDMDKQIRVIEKNLSVLDDFEEVYDSTDFS